MALAGTQTATAVLLVAVILMGLCMTQPRAGIVRAALLVAVVRYNYLRLRLFYRRLKYKLVASRRRECCCRLVFSCIICFIFCQS